MDLSLGIASFLLSSIVLYSSQILFLRKGITDKINHRSSHKTIATRSGGLSIAITISIISFYFYLIGSDIYNFSLLIPLILLLMIGLYDDIYNVDFKLKFIFQIIAAKLIVDSGLIIDNLHGLFGIYELNRFIAHIITIFIVVAIINAINFIDGIDGLAITIVTTFIILFELFSSEVTPFRNFTIIIISTIVPLYYFNFRLKNKIFLGDSGSLFLGGIVSIYTLYILSNNYIIKSNFDLNKIIFVFSILSYPIVDIIRIFFKRIISGASPFLADKNHIHHRLLNIFKSHILVVASILSFSIILLIFIQVFLK
jgi:UDP-N-acetylmuramyl pentapeptide phosphotransferase/UDP-N-acetylglucosamine-1-phosphate transferase